MPHGIRRNRPICERRDGAVTATWMTALEMQYRAYGNVCRAIDRFNDDPGAEIPESFKHVCATNCYDLGRSQAFAWSTATATAVLLASKSIPPQIEISTLRLPEGVHSCWWWFETPLPLWRKGDGSFKTDLNHVVALHCQSFDDWDSRIGITGYRWREGIGPIPGPIVFIKPGALLSAIEEDAKAQPGIAYAIDAVRFFLAACAWLEQRILTIGCGHIERHRRKQLGREHNAPVPSDVKVIELRRAESQGHEATTSEPVEWSCRWIVNGHWRNQYCGLGHDRKLVYIMPFVKGPADKPLRVPSHTVYAVTR